MKGKLIIIDGIDGSGTTTQTKLLYEFLKENKLKVFLTKEPYDQEIIKILAKNKNELIDLFLFLADRVKHFELIKKYLEKNYIVISDRGFPSTLAYQFYASNLKNEIKEDLAIFLNHLAMNHIYPDLIIILDIEAKLAIKRLKIKNKKSEIRKFEKKAYLEKVREGFLYFSRKLKWKIIDSSKPIEVVHQEIIKEILKII